MQEQQNELVAEISAQNAIAAGSTLDEYDIDLLTEAKSRAAFAQHLNGGSAKLTLMENEDVYLYYK